MFRISRAKYPSANISFPAYDGDLGGSAIGKYCSADEWSGDLSSGLFRLGALGERLHGLAAAECGLLTLLRCYEEKDRVRILELLEGASSSTSSFCFSTHITTGPEAGRPLLCIGHSSGFDDEHEGRMNGIFIFPHIPMDNQGH